MECCHVFDSTRAAHHDQGLGDAGAATLRAVVPGISDALVTTAAGLFAAIPAVIAYNEFTDTTSEERRVGEECRIGCRAR